MYTIHPPCGLTQLWAFGKVHEEKYIFIAFFMLMHMFAYMINDNRCRQNQISYKVIIQINFQRDLLSYWW